jgi:acetolactate synthase-1/2/3 large subunit
VCIATSGPGATNVITGMATAAMDSVPLVVIAGQVARPLLGSDAFQEADIFGMTLSVVKHSFFVQHLAELPRALRGAFYLAASGRPGPVLVTIPVDVLRASGPFFYPAEVTFPGYRPGAWEDLSRLDEAADLLRRAERPVFLVGGGVIRGEAWDPLFRAATRHGVPVATTLMGKGAFPESSPLALGLLGMHGTPVANRALTEADLVVAVGTRFSDRSTG